MNNPLKNVVIVAVILIVLYIITNYYQNANFTKSDIIFSGDKSEIVKILIQKGEDVIQLDKQDTTWHIAGVDTLIIRQNRIDDLFDKVLEVKRTTIRSRKESNWINYSVDDSTGTHLAVIDSKGETISYYVFGRSKSDYSRSYVRLGNDPKVYLADQNITYMLQTRPTYWGEKQKEEVLPPPIIPIDTTTIN